MSKYEHLLQPIRIGNNVLLKNRMLSSNALPHFLQGPETWPNDPVMIYQQNIARNGAAIVTIGNWNNPDQHKGHSGDSVHFPSFDMNDASVENYIAQYIEGIHFYGSKATISLMATCPKGYGVEDSEGGGGFGFPPMGGPGGPGGEQDDDIAPHRGGPGGPPMEDMDPEEMERMMAMMGGGPKKALTRELMEQMCADLAKDAKYHQNLGFDGVSLHMAYQGPIGAQFLSPLCNHRTDEFGGSAENRVRFPLMMCKAIREACGKDFIIEVLFSGKEAEGGITIEDTVAFARAFEGTVDILQLRGGDGNEAHPTTWNSNEVPVTLEASMAIKAAGINILTAPIGGQQDPDLADKWIAEGKMDMMAAARAFIADPDYAEKLVQGRGDDVVPCIRCNKCHGLSMDGPWISVCSVNPVMGMEFKVDRMIKAPAKSKKVAVIGGGPAGMNAARVLVGRGHKVSLYEKAPVLGGQLIHSDYFGRKWTIKKFKDFLIAQMDKLGVEVHLGCAATPEMIKAGGFDAVVVALGSEPNIPDIPGLRKADGSLADKVVTPISTFGHVDELGQRVVVVGGSEVGCETAMYIAETGREVTIITRQTQLAPSAQRVHYELPVEGYCGIKKKTGCTTTRFEDGVVTYVNYKGVEKTIECDTLVMSGGLNPRQEEALGFYGAAPEFYVCGECADSGEGTIQKVMRSSWATASQV